MAEPLTMTDGWVRRVYQRPSTEPAPGVHPAVRFLFAEMARQQCYTRELAARTGYGEDTIRKWKSGTRAPGLAMVDDCLHALGFRLTVTRIRSGKQ